MKDGGAPQVYHDTAREFAWSPAETKHYGRGRVGYIQLGHKRAICSVPCVARAILDGLQHAAGDLAERTMSRKGS